MKKPKLPKKIRVKTPPAPPAPTAESTLTALWTFEQSRGADASQARFELLAAIGPAMTRVAQAARSAHKASVPDPMPGRFADVAPWVAAVDYRGATYPALENAVDELSAAWSAVAAAFGF